MNEWCCKAVADPILCEPPEGTLCRLGIGFCGIACKGATTCCKSQSHLCCLVGSGAYPPDDEVMFFYYDVLKVLLKSTHNSTRYHLLVHASGGLVAQAVAAANH